MAAVNTAGFVELLKSSAASFDAAFESAMPMHEALFEPYSYFILIASFVGSIIAVLAMPTGVTNIETLKKHTGILAATWFLVFPFYTVTAQQINPASSDSREYDIGVGVYAAMRTFSHILDATGDVANYITVDQKARLVGATSMALGSLTDGSYSKASELGYTESILNVANSYFKQCNRLLSIERSQVNDYMNLDILQQDKYWKSVGLLGGQTLGLLENPVEELTPKENSSGSFWFEDDDEEYAEPEAIRPSDVLRELENLAPVSGFMLGDDGILVQLPPSDDPDSLGVLTRYDIPGLQDSYTKTLYEGNPLQNESFYLNYIGADNRLNALNCYQLYLIANKAMYLANQYVADNSLNAQTMALAASISGGTGSFEEIQETIEEAKESNFFIVNGYANEALQANYRSNDSTGSEIGDTAANFASSTAISYFETKDGLLVQSFALDLAVPIVFGGIILAITFVLSFLPILMTVSLMLPGNIESNFAWLKLILFLVLFLVFMTLMYSFLDVWIVSATETMVQNIIFYNEKPSIEVASIMKSLTWGGFFIIIASGFLSLLIVYNKTPILSMPSSPKISGPSIPKPGKNNNPNKDDGPDSPDSPDSPKLLGWDNNGPNPNGVVTSVTPPSFNGGASESYISAPQDNSVIDLSTDDWSVVPNEPIMDDDSSNSNRGKSENKDSGISPADNVSRASSSNFVDIEDSPSSNPTTNSGGESDSANKENAMPSSFDVPSSRVDVSSDITPDSKSMPSEFDVPPDNSAPSGSDIPPESPMPSNFDVPPGNSAPSGYDIPPESPMPSDFDVPPK